MTFVMYQKLILFADDTNSLYQHDNYNVLCKIINDVLLILSNGFLLINCHLM